jgi:endoglucanase
MDIKNEPRSATVGGHVLKPTWGTGGQTDFAAMYTTAGNLIHQINPRPLMICEGLNYACDLTGVASHPVRLNEANKVVYSMHDYAWSGHKGQNQAAYNNQMHKNGGYLLASNTAPVWIGEFGHVAATLPTHVTEWWDYIMAWQKDQDADWCWWALNPTHGQSSAPGTDKVLNQQGAAESYGLLTPNWSGVGYPAVVTMLKAIVPPRTGPGIG